jgi:hypothetical protein
VTYIGVSEGSMMSMGALTLSVYSVPLKEPLPYETDTDLPVLSEIQSPCSGQSISISPLAG